MDQVEEIKQKTDIVALIGQYVSLKKAGRHYKGLCPFHGEKTPSFMVNEELGLYKCFGCGAGGDAIKFLMEIEGVDFIEALKQLAEKSGVKLEMKKMEAGDGKKDLLEVLDLASRYYHYLLTEHEEGRTALDYLKERSINDKLIEKFNLGFSLPSWDGLIKYLVKKKGYKEDLLERAGLVNKRNTGSGYYDKFRGRVMFPIQDPSGKVVGFSGRILPSLANSEDAKYMNSPETELYHKGKSLYGFYQAKQFIREKKQVVVVEGMLDLISSYGAGVGESVAVGGTALTSDQVDMLARLSDKIILAMDADEAGTSAIKRSVEVAENRGMNIKVVQIVGGKDPDEIARKSPNAWKEMVDKAVSIYEYVLSKSLEKYPEGNEDRIRNVAADVIPFLAKIDQEMIRDKWVKKLAESLEIEKESVVSEIRKVRSGIKSDLGVKKEVSVKRSDPVNQWLSMLIDWLMLADEKLVRKIHVWFRDIDIAGSEGKLLSWLFVNKGGESPEDIVKKVPSELKALAEDIVMKSELAETPNVKDIEKLAAKVLREVIENKIKDLEHLIELAEKAKQNDEAEKLYEEVVRLNKKNSEIAVILA